MSMILKPSRIERAPMELPVTRNRAAAKEPKTPNDQRVLQPSSQAVSACSPL